MRGIEHAPPEIVERAHSSTAAGFCRDEVIPGYTGSMKTAISVPDETFEEAERRANALGVNRSEFFTTAVQHYLRELEAKSLTEHIDTALDAIGEDDSTQAAVHAGRMRLAESDDEW